MTSSLHRNSASLAVIQAAVITSLGVFQPAEAAVTWLVSDDGANLTITTDGGSLDVGTTVNSGVTTGIIGRVTNDGPTFYVWNGNVFFAGAGTAEPFPAWEDADNISANTVDGDTFGYSRHAIYWDGTLGSSPGMITPNSTMTFSNLTVADAFGSTLDSGPVLLWTHDTTGDTISVALVPEPSSIALFGFGLGSLVLRRKRKQGET